MYVFWSTYLVLTFLFQYHIPYAHITNECVANQGKIQGGYGWLMTQFLINNLFKIFPEVLVIFML